MSLSPYSFLLRATACVKAIENAFSAGHSLPDDQAPVVRDLGNGLCVVYLVETDQQLVYVQNNHLAAADMHQDALHELGLINLSQRAEKGLRIVNHGPVQGLLMDGAFEASLMLLDDLWSKALASRTPNGPVVAIPTRDVLAFCDARSEAGKQELHKVVQRVGKGGGPLLTERLYRRTAKGWVEEP